MDYLINNDYIQSSIRNEIAIISMKGKIFDLVTNLDESNRLIDLIYAVEKDRSVKALLLTNEPGCLGEKEYDDFLGRIMAPGSSLDDCNPPTIMNKRDRFREITILNKIISVFANFRKLCFTGVQDNLVTPFIGIIMASDIRYMADNAYFSLAHNKYGLHPSGGIPFFFPKMMSYPKALEMLFTEKIPAELALENHLVNKILPAEDFIEHCTKEIKVFTRFRSCTISNTKRLTNFDRWALSEYFEFEAGLINI